MSQHSTWALLLMICTVFHSVLLQTIEFEMKRNKTFRFYTFMAPCEKQIKEAYVENVKVRRLGKEYAIDYDFHLSADVTNFKVEVYFSRCSSREALDTCETMPKFSTNYGCKFVTAQNTAWTDLVTCSTPKLTCPVKKVCYCFKGFYKYRNCKLDLTLYSFMPLGRAYWRVQIIMSVRDKALCFKCEGNVIN